MVLAAYKTFSQDVCVTRCTNNYGPYQFPEKLVPFFLTSALEDKPLPLYGDGKNVRSWLHVDDHSRALMLVATKGRAGEVYNLGGDDSAEKENIFVTKEILRLLGKPESLIKQVKDRLGHDRRYAVDFSKIKKELGWEPKVTFEKGLEDTVNWYLENRAWWESVRDGEYLSFYDKYYRKRLA
jgi:dTDP-glucose 4,6-dehydratase